MPITLNGTTGITTPNLSSSGTVTTTNLVNGSPLSFRNKIINGNFDIWQRGNTIASNNLGNNIYSADRWIIRGEGSTGTVTRQEFTLGQTEVPDNPVYFSRIAVTSVAGASNSLQFRQRIENIRTLAGKTATLTFWAKSNVSKTIGVYFNHEVGTGGTGDAIGIGPGVFNLSTTWQKITHTVTIPSIAGKTIGEGNFIGLDIFLDAGSNFNAYFSPSVGQQSATVDIAQVQLEEGSVATPFELRPIGTELALCQRYYQTSGTSYGANWLRFNANVSSGTGYSAVYFFKTQMRIDPDVTVTNAFTPQGFLTTTGTLGVGDLAFIETRTAQTNGSATWTSSFTANAEL